MKVKDFLYDIAETFFVSLIVLRLIFLTVAAIEVVWGSSMEPNFFTGERILVEKLTKHFEEYKRGDIVVLVPNTDRKHYIKRIVGVPGDVIKVLDCQVYISKDGKRFVLDEYYLADGVCTRAGDKLTEGRSIELEEDEYVVLGDNRNVSVDSRVFGVVEKKQIIGKVIFRFWPFDKIGFI